MLIGAVLILTGCPSGIVTDSINADSSREYTILPQFANFPVVAASTDSSHAEVVVTWKESYPTIKEYSEVIAVFPHSISGWYVSDSRFRLNTEYNLLEWKDVRQQGTYQLEFFDADDTVQYRMTLLSMPSQFIGDAFKAAAGTGAMQEQWWVNMKTSEYFYVAGTDAGGSPVSYKMVFVSEHGDSVDEYAILKSEMIGKLVDIDELYTIPALDELEIVNTEMILKDLKDRASELCAPPEGITAYEYTHEYVVTRSKVVQGRLRALTGSQNFLLLSQNDQRECFTTAYLFEILPSKKPITAEKHRDSLPSGMRYDEDQYDLVWNEDFDGTLQNLYDENYDIEIRGFEPHDVTHPYRAAYSFLITPYTYDDPIKIEDGKLFIGYGLRSAYSQENGRDVHECDPTKLENMEDSLNPQKCPHRVWVNKVNPPYYFKYGYLEIQFARTSTFGNAMYVWLRAHPDSLVLNKERRNKFYVDRGAPTSELPLRKIYDSGVNNSTIEWESKFYGSEFQLMEMNIMYPNGLYWTVNHYGASYPTQGNARFFYTMQDSNFPLKSRYGYAVEWAPDGYIIWIKKSSGGWIKHSINDFVARDNSLVYDQSHCGDRTGGKAATIDAVTGIVQCGVNHVPMTLSFSGVGAPKYSFNARNLMNYFANKPNAVRVADRFARIEHIRLYKPHNNYADINPIYQ